MDRRETVVAHIVSDAMALIVAAVFVAVLVLASAPTWALIIVAVVTYLVVAHYLGKELGL